jgi:hypothetical protein
MSILAPTSYFDLLRDTLIPLQDVLIETFNLFLTKFSC